MERSSQSAAKFIRELSELAERLAARDVVVASLHADYPTYLLVALAVLIASEAMTSCSCSVLLGWSRRLHHGRGFANSRPQRTE